MSVPVKPFLLVTLLALAACTATPQIQLSARDMTMEVKSKVSVVLVADYSPDGKGIAAGSVDGTVTLWDLAGARPIRTLNSRAGSVVDVAYSPDGKTIAVSNTGGVSSLTSDDLTVLWDVSTGAQVNKFADNFGGTLSFSPDGRRVLGGSYLGNAPIRLRDTKTGSVIREFQGSRALLSGNGKYVVVSEYQAGGFFSSGDFFTYVVDVATGRVLWREKTGNRKGVALSPDGRHVLAAARVWDPPSASTSFKLFDFATGALAKEFGQARFSVGLTIDSAYLVDAIAFSPDGKQFLSGDAGGHYRLWDITTGTMVRQLKTPDEAAGPPAVKFSPDGRTAVVILLASTRLFDVATGNELATMITFEDGEWLVTTPSGYYNASEKGDQYLNVTVGGRPYSISQLRESFYRPDLVKLALSGRAVEGMRKMADIKPPPALAIVETPWSVSSEETTVKVKVADQGGGVGDVRLYLNGSAIALDRAGTRPAAASQILSYKVRLVSGKNSIRAIAFNADNSMQSSEAAHEIEAKIAATKPSLHALVIGIQEYENPALTLLYPVADARLMATTLRERAPGLFQEVNVVELTTRAQTTKQAIIEALRAMASRVRPDDLFVFFVASHGTVDDGQYFLITSNVGSTSTHLLKQAALTQDDLKVLIANIPATKKLVLIDTCNAGKLGEAIQMAVLTRGMNEETALKILSRAVGSTVISASTSLQQAVEGYKNHGLFTWVLVEGLNGAADGDKDGFVKTHELVNYVDDRVPALAEQVFSHKQYPTTTLSGQGFPVTRAR